MAEAQTFQEQFPEIHDSFRVMQERCAAWGPLDDRARTLIELALASVRMQQNAVRAQSARALKLGISADEIRHAILLTLGNAGLSSVMASLAWTHEVLGGSPLQ